MSRLILKNISYTTPSGKIIFQNLSYSFNEEITGLIGKNGSGKSTLAKIADKQIIPPEGTVKVSGKLKYLPQTLENLQNLTLLDIFSLKEKFEAINRLEKGKGDKSDLLLIANDWNPEKRINEAKEKMGIPKIDLTRSYESLSGGEKVRCMLASLLSAEPEFIILDEPTNHLDFEGRDIVYNFVKDWKRGMIVITHDRQLLRLVNCIAELSPAGLKSYGGGYDLYLQRKKMEEEAADNQIRNLNSELKKSIKIKNEVLEHQQRRMKSGGKKADKSNLPKIMKNQLKGEGEKTLKKLEDIHNRKINETREKLSEVKLKTSSNYKIRFDLKDNMKHKHSNLITAEGINYSYMKEEKIWKKDLSFTVYGGERILLKGKNGSGKTTLLKMIRGEIIPDRGNMEVRTEKIASLDQDVSILNNELSLLENINNAAKRKLPEHELRIRLGRFLFYKDDVFKKANVLSGGERMRAGLACLLSSHVVPDLIILDEPTNNLDLESIEELTNGLNNFDGTILVVSHDTIFLEDIGVERIIDLDE